MTDANGKSLPFREGIYTLAQSGTSDNDRYSAKGEKVVFGNGTDHNNNKALKGRARRKTITQILMLHLIDVAKQKGAKKRVQQYWNAYHCQTNLISADGRLYGKYCKNRFCTICTSIRKAEMINKYLPVIKTWKEPRFVTLTVKAVKEDKLNLWIRAMKVAFQKTLQRCKKRHQRGTGVKLMGIKSLECNFNPDTNTYNPHYHLVVASDEIANTLIIEWQVTWNEKEKLTSPFAQDKRKVESLESVLIEVIKYGSKIFTEPDVKKKKNSKIPPTVYAAALDNIFTALKGYRIFDRFGFTIPKQVKPNFSKGTFVKEYTEWIFDITINDWVNHSTGELLTGYVPSSQLQYLLNNNIDTDAK